MLRLNIPNTQMEVFYGKNQRGHRKEKERAHVAKNKAWSKGSIHSPYSRNYPHSYPYYKEKG